MDSVVIPKTEMAVRLIIGSSRRGANSLIQNPDGDFLRNMEDTPLMTASSRTDLRINKNYDTRNSENVDHGDFPVSKSRCHQQSHSHHAIRLRD